MASSARATCLLPAQVVVAEVDLGETVVAVYKASDHLSRVYGGKEQTDRVDAQTARNDDKPVRGEKHDQTAIIRVPVLPLLGGFEKNNPFPERVESTIRLPRCGNVATRSCRCAVNEKQKTCWILLRYSSSVHFALEFWWVGYNKKRLFLFLSRRSQFFLNNIRSTTLLAGVLLQFCFLLSTMIRINALQVEHDDKAPTSPPLRRSQKITTKSDIIMYGIGINTRPGRSKQSKTPPAPPPHTQPPSTRRFPRTSYHRFQARSARDTDCGCKRDGLAYTAEAPSRPPETDCSLAAEGW